jgi:regulator of protease activity HflC (stomatin/prohibitin superfamily)
MIVIFAHCILLWDLLFAFFFFHKVLFKMKRIFTLSILAAAVLATGCTRIETGEVGVRVGFDKQVQSGELLPGSFNQVIIGDVLTFPVKDVNVVLENMTPVAKDNSTMKDFDAVVVYNINPQQVAELYSTKNKSFHAEAKGDTYVMYNYIVQNARNAIYKAARKYEALDMADNRTDMENYIKEEITRNLAEEKLDGSIMINQVMIRNVLPSDTVVESANALVRSKNELKQKEVEVKTAEAESRRMAALANNSGSSIAFMQAQAMLNISEGIKNGKVQTIVVPSNFNALMMNK